MGKLFLWFKMFYVGYRRKSMVILDNCGLPFWLSSYICKPTRKDRGLLKEIHKILDGDKK